MANVVSDYSVRVENSLLQYLACNLLLQCQYMRNRLTVSFAATVS